MALAPAFGTLEEQTLRTHQVKNFRTWLQTPEGLEASTEERSTRFLTKLGINPFEHLNGVAYQHVVGLALRELLRQDIKAEINNTADPVMKELLTEQLEELEGVAPGSERRFKDLSVDMLKRLGESFGMDTTTSYESGHPTIHSGTKSERQYAVEHSGSTTGSGGHYDAAHATGQAIGNGNCGANAFALIIAKLAGVALAATTPGERGAYIGGAEIPDLVIPPAPTPPAMPGPAAPAPNPIAAAAAPNPIAAPATPGPAAPAPNPIAAPASTSSQGIQERYDAALAKALDQAYKAGLDDKTAFKRAESTVAGQSTEFKEYQQTVVHHTPVASSNSSGVAERPETPGGEMSSRPFARHALAGQHLGSCAAEVGRAEAEQHKRTPGYGI